MTKAIYARVSTVKQDIDSQEPDLKTWEKSQTDPVRWFAHREDESVILDLVARYKAPFSPTDIIREMCLKLKEYRCRWVMGDNYAAEFVRSGFKSHGLKYRRCKDPKSKLYLEMLPWIGSVRLALLDDQLILKQISSLERRVRAGGKDIIDHPLGAHDDLANVVAGVIHVVNYKKFRITRSL